jgi:hypothetical protein
MPRQKTNSTSFASFSPVQSTQISVLRGFQKFIATAFIQIQNNWKLGISAARGSTRAYQQE